MHVDWSSPHGGHAQVFAADNNSPGYAQGAGLQVEPAANLLPRDMLVSTQRVLVIAAGSPETGRGGLGHRVLTGLRELPVAQHWWLTLVGDSQFQLEHAMHLQINDLAIFVHIEGEQAAPIAFRRVHHPAGYRISTTSQDLSPSDVLHALATISRRETLPLCFELTLEQQSEPAAGSREPSLVAAAVSFLGKLLEDPDPRRWDECEIQ